MRGAQPLENPLRRVALLAVLAPILGKPGIDDLGEPIQLGPLDLGLPPIARWHREAQHLPHAVARDTKMTRRLAPAHPVPTGQADLPIQIHGENAPALPVARKGKSGRLLRRPQRDHPAATVADFRTGVHTGRGDGTSTRPADGPGAPRSRRGRSSGPSRGHGATSRRCSRTRPLPGLCCPNCATDVTFPFPGQTYRTQSVSGVPRTVKWFEMAALI